MALMMLTLPIIVLELPYTLLVAMGKIVEQNVATYVGLGGFTALALVAIRLGLGLNGLVGASLVGRVIRLAITWGFLYDAMYRERVGGI